MLDELSIILKGQTPSHGHGRVDILFMYRHTNKPTRTGNGSHVLRIDELDTRDITVVARKGALLRTLSLVVELINSDQIVQTTSSNLERKHKPFKASCEMARDAGAWYWQISVILVQCLELGCRHRP